MSAPTSGGSSAATSPRKTQNESSDQQRERDRLRPQEIVLDRPADLLVADHSAAERDRRVVREPLLDALRGAVAHAVVERLEQRDDEGRASVARDHRPVARRVHGQHARRRRLAAQPRDRALDVRRA